MKHQEFTAEDIYKAYRRVKNYFYYDNVSLFSRKQIADFENEIMEKTKRNKLLDTFFLKTKKLLDFLNDDFSASSFWTDLLDHITIRVLPKKVSYEGVTEQPWRDEGESIHFLSNEINKGCIDANSVNYIVDVPVELHIISVLWLTFVGSKYSKIVNPKNYAYRFQLEDDDSLLNNFSQNRLAIYSPYYIGYQKWRDQALNHVNNILDKHDNATLISLDIKRYFYNVRINIPDFCLELNNNYNLNIDLSEYKIKRLNDLLQDIHSKVMECKEIKQYLTLNTERILWNKKTILPLGLISSGFISNLYLKKFDEKVCKNLVPDYYGRYVDDMLFVVKEYTSEKNIRKTIESLFIETGLLAQSESSYYLKEFPELEIQPAKIIIEHFNHKESRAAINNFKRNIESQKSEFRFLPDEEEVDKDFDNAAFTIQYSDSINKIRSIKDFKEDKYGTSKYLAKKIFLSIYSTDVSPKSYQTSCNQILSFFKGRVAIDFFSLWEKVATFFIINNDLDSLRKFDRNVDKSLDNLVKKDKEYLGDFDKDLLEYKKIAIATPFALNLNFGIEAKDDQCYTEIKELATKIRYANMFRQSLVSVTAINYTCLLYKNVNLFKPLRDDLCKMKVDPKIYYFSPRYVKFEECCIIHLYKTTAEMGVHKSFKQDNKTYIKYLTDASEMYNRINNFFKLEDKEDIKGNDIFYELKSDNKNKYDYITLKSDEDVSYQSGKLRIAIANMKVDTECIYKAKVGKTDLSIRRRKELFNIINEAVKYKADLLVLPELSVPHEWMDLLAFQSKKHKICIIAGLTYIYNQNNLAFNIVAAFIPVQIKNYSSCVIVSRIKNHYSPAEIRVLENYRYKVPVMEKSLYQLIHWRKSYFSIYNCFELASIEDRAIFKSKVDFIVATELNKDINYYSDIAGSWARDMHCFFIQVNTSTFGDSRIMKPSDTVHKNLVTVKGGINAITLIDDIDIDGLRDFQLKGYELQEADSRFKKTPPMFDKDLVLKRIKNQEIN